MGPPSTAPDYSSAKDAKDLLDMIGKDVHDQVKNGAEKYKEALKGYLYKANGYILETLGTTDTCQLVEEYRSKANGGDNIKRYPCGNTTGDAKKEERFSDTQGAECANSKMRSDGKGACAPYRRLHLCDHNLETIETTSTTSDTLLAEVCMAAKYEGDLIKTHYTPYQQKYGDSPYQLCTVLARSFADIGDIVRGRDLYSGNSKEKNRRQQLDDKLKKIFGKIYNDVTSSGRNKRTNGAEERYKDGSGNYYKLREDWWYANRETVWKAITCEAPEHASYFRATCNGGERTEGYCRCNGDQPGNDKANVDPPTYFDYVPQYLRWFEEWAEDFCRKKNKKVENLQKQCRGQYQDADRYCSRNGYDCEKTVRARGKLRYGNRCIDCLYACNPYVEWIEKQKEQFDKQVKKYQTEIRKYKNGAPDNSNRRKGGTTATNYEEYEKKFYDILKDKYKDEGLNKFLEKLSNEEICTKVKDDKGGRINFEKVNSGGAVGGASGDRGKGASADSNSNKTFYRSEYCQPCPLCGVEKKSDGSGNKWERKDIMDKCPSINLYKPIDDKGGTTINFLYSGDETNEIAKNLKAFCDQINRDNNNGEGAAAGGRGDSGTSGSNELYQKWKCYHVKQLVKDKDGVEDEVYNQEVEHGGGLCILPNPKKNKEESQSNSQKEPDEIQKTFNNFFYYWVAHMLKDSIHWRTEKIKGCLENGTKTRCKNNKKCKTDCDCFQKWIDKKKNEWEKIVEHFKTQEGFANKGGMDSKGFLDIAMRSPDFVLESVLELEFSNENSTKDAENKVSAEEAKEIKHLRDIIKKKKQEDEADASDGKKKTLMDKLIDYEKGEAKTCLDTHKSDTCPQSSTPEGRARAETFDPPAGRSDADAEDDDEEEDEEEEEDDDDVGAEDHQDTTEETVAETQQPQEPPTTTTQDGVKPACDIVNTLFTTPKSLDEACNQKYAPPQRHWGWKCVDTTTTKPGSETARSSEKGSICIPPRRRRLYVGKLETLDTDSTSQNDGKTPSEKLRTAFIQSAAVETFFLWDRYKKENTKRQSGGVGGLGLDGGRLSGEDDDPKPEDELKSGKIPDGFLRQMFYTLADYKDIFEGKNMEVVNLLKDGSPSDKEMQERESKIKDAINNYFSNSVSTPAPRGNPSNSVTTPQQTWWEQYGKDIWEGMICALTYKENGSGGKTIEKDETADYTKLTEKLKTQYGDYNSVKLEDEPSDTRPITPGSSSPSGVDSTINNPKLKDFVEIPTFFRWLHEWGSDFCVKRAQMLKDVRDNCRNSEQEGKRHCSGDGHDCKDDRRRYNDMFASLDCPDCYEQCRKYKKWVHKKFDEYHKQEKKYEEEHEKLTNGDNYSGGGDNTNFCQQIKEKKTAAGFLQSLKHCKDGQTDEEKKSSDPNNKINFEEPLETFGPLEYCKTCPFNRVTCNRRGRNNQCTEVNGKVKSWDSVFNGIPENGGKTTTITVEMIDRRGPYMKEYMEKKSQKLENSENSLFKTSRLFKGIREQKWTCKFKDKNTDVCHLTNFNDNIDLNQYTTFKVLIVYWLEDFLYGYYLLKNKIEKCTKNGGNTCDKEPKNYCACVKKWLNQKKEEWKQIQKRFNEKYKDVSQQNKSSFRSFLEELIPQIGAIIDKGNHKCLQKLVKLLKCNYLESSKEEKGNEGIQEENDLVLCLLENLGKKITECQSKHSGDTPSTCDEKSPSVEDDDEPLEEEETEENTVAYPKICGDVIPKEEAKEEEKCEPPATIPEPPAGPAEPEPEPESPQDQTEPPAPAPSDEPFDSTILQTTIPFGVALALGSIAFLFLKKKTKSSVGNLFQILQIPKGDYDIPTLKSSNRYIPYASDRHKGKTYIYMEGDSSGDEKYAFMSDTTDVTSSESEYEELDINDIYVPGSPKYKTLIEVVLEPSKRDIPSGDIPHTNKFSDDEWNQLKHDFISNMLQNQPNDVPNDYKSENVTLNTQPDTLYFDKPEEKPFITSIHDRNLYSGEEYSYDINMVNTMDDIPINRDNNPYSGIDLINDSLNSNQHIDIYDEVLKRKENELFGTYHTKKNTSTNSVAKNTNSDPIHNQIKLFHKWLDRHRHMCDQWDKNKKEELLDKLKEEWNKENNNNSGKTYNSDNKPSHNHVLNTDVSIQIDMDNPKTKNEFTNTDTSPDKSTMDTIIDDLEKYNEPYYYDFYEDDIYYDVNDDKASVDNINMDHNKMDNNNSDVPTKVQIEMNVINNQELLQNEYPISDM
ncbi:erythrocyte membrane protein 1 [Plasmodium falciparum IGH-CR14]|uniref:Erythrocyte membrane protein 1 n=1 Tax=Plasmodium falciparum IGH-CR14 TaxID=580059 RepID=A0A0L1IFK6_PLAFA|nr:erythrocyte membrane protein 1 [Plasmodium falciparum IGH-CR14]